MLIDPSGDIVGKYRKVHPAALLSIEKIYFRGGSSFPVFRIGEWCVGFSICYDNLFPESCRCLAIAGAELIIAPYATPIDDPWENFLTTRALEDVGQEHDYLPARSRPAPGQRDGRADPLCRGRAGAGRGRTPSLPALSRSSPGRVRGYRAPDRSAA
jgi:hypothetical protein